MPVKAKRTCRFQGCPELTNRKSGYCLRHEKVMMLHYECFTRGYDRHERYGNTWQKIRLRYIHAHPLCETCKRKGKYVQAKLEHHIKPIAEGGTNAEENLMSLCVSCHEKIHKRKKSYN